MDYITNKDEKLCLDVCSAITDKYGSNTVALKYPQLERVVAMVISTTGYVGNGGFRYLFSSDLPGDQGFILTMDAFRQIKCNTAADTIKAALNCFPNGIPQQDLKTREKYLKSLPEDIFNPYNTIFWKEDENIIANLATFIKVNNLDKLLGNI